MVKKNDSKLLPTFKNTQNLKVIEFEIFRNSKYVSNFQNFKSLLSHVNGV